jgi:hypothetical protein
MGWSKTLHDKIYLKTTNIDFFQNGKHSRASASTDTHIRFYCKILNIQNITLMNLIGFKNISTIKKMKNNKKLSILKPANMLPSSS